LERHPADGLFYQDRRLTSYTSIKAKGQWADDIIKARQTHSDLLST